MLIRSQSKGALLPIEQTSIGVLDNEVRGKFGSAIYLMGKYSTEEKATKIVDMIQEKYIEIKKSEFLGMQESLFIEPVFQMPLDGDV